MPNFDVVIIGSGLAALTAAERLCKQKNVIIITKLSKQNSNSYLAQGGVASAISHDDDWTYHYQDTLIAGCHHNYDEAVKLLVQNGPKYIAKLIESNFKFDVDQNGKILLGREGAHCINRILHAGGDATGSKLMAFMLNKVKNNVQIIEDEMAIELIVQNQVCVGVETMDEKGNVKQYLSPHVILATGGCGGLYSTTSNDTSITGDGIALSFRAGVEISDMEFIQFHPTLLNINGVGVGLISEAVRGEGARLVNQHGHFFMEGIHELKDLAPRDVVSRAVFAEIQKGNKVFLDISMISHFAEKFPTIHEMCVKHGINPSQEKLPILPGAHFLMGGVKTNLAGQTSLPGLYAVGEVARTGVHGANRLASNSLLEGLVFGNMVADDILSSTILAKPLYVLRESGSTCPIDIQLPTREMIQEIMMKYVGIIRDEAGLKFAIDWFESYLNKMKWHNVQLTKEEHGIVNMLTVGWLIATSALMRNESRGGHYRADYPLSKHEWKQKELIRTIHEQQFVSV